MNKSSFNVQFYELKDFTISKFLLMPISDSSYCCHVYTSNKVLILVTQKNKIREFKSIDTAYRFLTDICAINKATFEVGRLVS